MQGSLPHVSLVCNWWYKWLTSSFSWDALLNPPRYPGLAGAPCPAATGFGRFLWLVGVTSLREILFLMSSPIFTSMFCRSCFSCSFERIYCITCAFKFWHSEIEGGRVGRWGRRGGEGGRGKAWLDNYIMAEWLSCPTEQTMDVYNRIARVFFSVLAWYMHKWWANPIPVRLEFHVIPSVL